jgi:hypothetical protein
MGMPQLSQLDVVVMIFSSVGWYAIRVGTLDQGAHRGIQRIGLTRWQPGHGAGEQVDAEHLAIPAQGAPQPRR